MLVDVPLCSSKFLETLSTMQIEGHSPYYYLKVPQQPAGSGVIYVAEREGVRVVEVSENGKIDTEEMFPVAGSSLKRIHLKGDYMYVAQAKSLSIYDITNILKPTLVGRLKMRESEGIPYTVAVNKRHAYLFSVGNVHALTIIDVSDPTKPFATNKMNVKGKVIDAVFQDNVLYAFTLNGYILQWDFSNPILFSDKPDLKITQPAAAVAVYKEYLYAAVDHDLRIYYTKGAELEDAFRVNLGSHVSDVVWYRGRVYASTDEGISVVDVSNPRDAFLIKSLTTNGRATSIRVLHTYKALFTDDSGLTCINIKEDAKRTPLPTVLPDDEDDDVPVKKRKKIEDDIDEDDNKKKRKRKRPRKHEEDEDSEDDATNPPKKQKTSPKKQKTAKPRRTAEPPSSDASDSSSSDSSSSSSSSDSDVASPPPPKKTKKPVVEDSNSDSDSSSDASSSSSSSTPVRAPSKKVKKVAESEESDDEDDTPPPKRRKVTPRPRRDDDDDEDSEDAVRSQKLKKLKKKRALKDASDDDDTSPATPKGKTCGFTLKPTSKLNHATFHEGLHAWTDLPESRFIAVPSWLQDSTVYVPQSGLKEGTQIEVSCCERSCDVFVFFEHCVPCSSQSNGGLPGILLSGGWVATTCGPTFKVKEDGVSHPTVVFRKQLAKNDKETVAILTKKLKFVGFATTPLKAECPDLTKRSACKAQELCTWDTQSSICAASLPSCDTTTEEKGKNACFGCAASELE